MLPEVTLCVYITDLVSLSSTVWRLSWTVVPVSSKSSSWMPGAGLGMWSCLTKHKPSSRVRVRFGFVQTVTKGQLCLGKLSAGSGIICCSSSSLTLAKGGGQPVVGVLWSTWQKCNCTVMPHLGRVCCQMSVHRDGLRSWELQAVL